MFGFLLTQPGRILGLAATDFSPMAGPGRFGLGPSHMTKQTAWGRPSTAITPAARGGGGWGILGSGHPALVVGLIVQVQ